MRGNRVTLLTYFTEWCDNCRYEAPDLVAKYGAHREDGLMIIGRSEYSHPGFDRDRRVLPRRVRPDLRRVPGRKRRGGGLSVGHGPVVRTPEPGQFFSGF